MRRGDRAPEASSLKAHQPPRRLEFAQHPPAPAAGQEDPQLRPVVPPPGPFGGLPNSYDHGHGGGHDHHESEVTHGHGEGAHSVAVGLVAVVIIVPIVMHMAMSHSHVAALTFKMLDTFVAIFLAVLWFNTFAQFLETFKVLKALPRLAPFLSLLQCLGLYAVALKIASAWRDDHLYMTTFCHVGAHFIAFAGIFAATQAQMEASQLPPPELQPLASFAFCIYIVFLMGGIAGVTWFVWRRHVKDEQLNHSIDHLELDIMGLVLSFATTQAVRHVIVGEYPWPHHFLLLQVGDAHTRLHHQWHSWVMFGWATALTALASYILPHLNDKAPDTIWAERLIHVTKVILIMLIAWGYLLWGEWMFYEVLFDGDRMFGHMVFSCIATLVCLTVLYSIAKIAGRLTSPQAIETQDIAITGISLVAAWSWEHCFNNAIDVIGQEYQVGYEGLVPKLVLSCVIPLFMMPVYVLHIRTRVLAIERIQRASSSRRARGSTSLFGSEAELIRDTLRESMFGSEARVFSSEVSEPFRPQREAPCAETFGTPRGAELRL